MKKELFDPTSLGLNVPPENIISDQQYISHMEKIDRIKTRIIWCLFTVLAILITSCRDRGHADHNCVVIEASINGKPSSRDKYHFEYHVTCPCDGEDLVLSNQRYLVGDTLKTSANGRP